MPLLLVELRPTVAFSVALAFLAGSVQLDASSVQQGNSPLLGLSQDRLASAASQSDDSRTELPPTSSDTEQDSDTLQLSDAAAVPPADEVALAEALDFTQAELRQRSQYSLGLGLGSVFAWQDLSLVWIKPRSEQEAWGISFGKGSFDLNENNEAQSFWIEAQVLSFYAFYRRYLSDFPIYWQLSQGLAFWGGSIRPRGNDQDNLDERLSLISDFASTSFNLSVSLRFSWHWPNHVFVEFAPLQFAASYIIQEEFTNNASVARETVRDKMEGPQSWSGVNLLIGYAF